MLNNTRRVAFSGIIIALAIALMLLGEVIGIGTYASPMLAGLVLLPAGEEYGRKTHFLLYIAVSLLSALVIGDVEETLTFVTIFGVYPILRPTFEKLPRGARLLSKLLYFNAVAILTEWLVMTLFVPAAEETWLLWTLLIAGNFAFLLYDATIPRLIKLYDIRLRKLFAGKR